MLLAAVTVFTLPIGIFALALGLELMVAPGRPADRATRRTYGSPSAVEPAPFVERPSEGSQGVSRAA
jgi:hypothetical protein